MFEDRKRELAKESRYLALQGLVAGREGNLSVRLGDYIIIKSSGARMLSIKPSSFSVLTISGELVEGPPPSMEYRMHLGVYKVRRDVGAVVHVHPPYTLALLAAGRSLAPATLEAKLYYSDVCVVKELEPGSEELAREVSEKAAEGCKVIALLNHGLVSLGENLKEAVDRAVAEERSAQVKLLSELLLDTSRKRK